MERESVPMTQLRATLASLWVSDYSRYRQGKFPRTWSCSGLVYVHMSGLADPLISHRW